MGHKLKLSLNLPYSSVYQHTTKLGLEMNFHGECFRLAWHPVLSICSFKLIHILSYPQPISESVNWQCKMHAFDFVLGLSNDQMELLVMMMLLGV